MIFQSNEKKSGFAPFRRKKAHTAPHFGPVSGSFRSKPAGFSAASRRLFDNKPAGFIRDKAAALSATKNAGRWLQPPPRFDEGRALPYFPTDWASATNQRLPSSPSTPSSSGETLPRVIERSPVAAV